MCLAMNLTSGGAASLSEPEPGPPEPPPRLPESPRLPDVTGTRARVSDARRRASGGSRSTILTSTRGAQDGAATVQKTLLGQ